MARIDSRLLSLERLRGFSGDHLRGWIDLEPGQSPLDALEGRAPGLYFMIDQHLNGPGFVGRVSASGKRTVSVAGGDYAQP